MDSFRKNIAQNLSDIDNPEVYSLNRWLNSLPIKECDADKIPDSKHKSTSLDTSLDSAKVPYGIFFYKGSNTNKNAYITFETVETTPVFFVFPEIETEFVEFSLFNYFLKKYDTVALNEIINIPDIKVKKLKALVYKVDLPQDYQKINLPSTDLTENVSENLINQSILEILSSEFLSEPNLITGNNDSVFLHNLQVNISEETTSKIENLSSNEPKKTIEDFNVKKNLSSEQPPISISEINLISDPIYNPEHKKLIRYLEPVYELTPALKSEILYNLPEYQKLGAEFLYANNFAFFNDSFELGKETQAVSALRMLLRTRNIQKVLIITNEYNDKLYKQNPLLGNQGLWQENLTILLHEYDFKFHTELSDFEKKNIFSHFIINGISYNIFEQIFNKGLFTHEELNLFDCIIFDDITFESLNLDCISLFEENSYENKLWFLSEFNSSELVKKISDLFPQRTLKEFGRESSEIDHIANKIFSYDFYLPLEKEFPEEECDLFEEAAKIKNTPDQKPKRTLQRLDQKKCNKANLLLHHLERVLDRNKRILVHFENDSRKIDQMAQLLEALKIKFVKFDSTDLSLNIENKLNQCCGSDEKMVYLSNLSPDEIDFTFPDVFHLINFDNSWNPLQRWKLEKVLDTPGVVCNYFYENSIEHELIAELTSDGLFDKNVIKVLPPEKFYKILDEKNSEKDLSTEKIDYTQHISSVFKLLEYVKLFLTNLGYDKLKTKASKSDQTYTINAKKISTGNEIRVEIIYSPHLNAMQINSILSEKSEDKPLLIITNGSISHSKVLLPPDVSLINGEMLSRYLELI